MAREVLLNPHYQHMRHSAAEQLRQLCLVPSVPEAYMWLLEVLAECRSTALQRPQVGTRPHACPALLRY